MKLFIDGLAADFIKGDGETAVVFLPGWTGTRYGPQRVFVSASHYAAEKGHSAIRFDFAGRGDSLGNAVDITLDMMIEDTVKIINWLIENEGITSVHLVGLCSGGNVALGAASLPEMIKYVTNVTCWSLLPFMEDKKLAKRQGTHRAKRLKGLLVKLFSKEGITKVLKREANVKGALASVAKDKEGSDDEKTKKTSYRRILNDVARNYKGSLHFIFGTRDPEADGSEIFYAEWCERNNKDMKVTKIIGAPHNFYTAHWTEQLIIETFS